MDIAFWLPYNDGLPQRYSLSEVRGRGMRLLFLGSTGDHAGQSLVTWAFARALEQRGLRVGFLKPLFQKEDSEEKSPRDEDCELFRQVLPSQESLESTCPVLRGEGGCGRISAQEAARVLLPILQARSSYIDLMMIMGRKEIFLDDPASPISDVSLVQALQADFILVTRYLDLPRTLYSLLSVFSLLGSRIKAIVLNRIPHQQMQEVSEGIRAKLSGHAMPPLFFVPEDPFLSARTLAEVVAATQGELLLGKQKVGDLVASWSMGAGHLLSGDMALFKRFYNRILLLGPPESGAEGPSRPVGVILTAGRRPPPVLLDAAGRMGLPLILCSGDTFATLEQLERTPSILSRESEPKADRMIKWLALGGQLDELWTALGLGPPVKGDSSQSLGYEGQETVR